MGSGMNRITRRQFIKTALAASAGIATLSEGSLMAQRDAQAKHPNLLFVFPDQMRRHAITSTASPATASSCPTRSATSPSAAPSAPCS